MRHTADGSTAHGTKPVVHVPGLGDVVGTVSSRYPDVALFYNIPYAEPPVGHLRWMPPVPYYGRFSENRTFTRPGPMCMQPDKMYTKFSSRNLARPNMANNLGMSEDCLTLNLAASHHRPRARPVMVFFHGGGWITGSGANYPADALVSTSNHEVIVVTINFRLGVFGFLGSRDLAARSFSKTGNYGIDGRSRASEPTRLDTPPRS
jgi:para-nitrobenzyl esterase